MATLEEANHAIRLLSKLITQPEVRLEPLDRPAFLGVDIGTANIATVVVDENGLPLGGEIVGANVVREGMVVDYYHAVQLVTQQIEALQKRLGVQLSLAASAVPPGTMNNNGRVTQNILETAGLNVSAIVDEPTAASKALGITDGVVIDVGGGTTGISILENGQMIYTADEPTGGFHMDLVLAGGLKISTEEAESLKRDAGAQPSLFPMLRPVFEKIASIVRTHIKGYKPEMLYLVGGPCAFPGFVDLMEKELQIKAWLPDIPLLVTPLGIAATCQEIAVK